MGQSMAGVKAYSLAEQIKFLGDEELLDFWEESQTLEGFLQEEGLPGDQSGEVYELLILRELQLRSSRRRQEPRSKA